MLVYISAEIGIFFWVIMKGLQMNQWISVKQRLPKINVNVWAWVIYSNGQEYGTETWLEQADNRSGAFGDWAMGSAKGYRVTHWMALPDPPKEMR
jgi:hypothetical protein